MQRPSKVTSELDILILGPVPPPFGGISVHVSRLCDLLVEAGFSVGVLNHFRSTNSPLVMGALNRNPFSYYRLPKKVPARIVHYHHSRWLHLVAVALGKRGSEARYILTLHAGDIPNHFPQLTSRVPFVSRITRWSLSRFDAIITVDPTIAEIVRQHTVDQRVQVVPAFLAAPARESDRYDSEFEAFLSQGHVLLVAAYGVQFLKDGRELYGLDTAVEAFVSLASKRRDLRLAVFVARRPSQRKALRHLHALEDRMLHASVSDRARIVYGLPLLPALRRNTIFVRPTRAEGDAVSVREAQWAGVPVVASDVIARPEDVRTFAVGDAAGLCAAIESVLDDSARESATVRQETATRGADPFSAGLIRLYQEELSRHPRMRRGPANQQPSDEGTTI